MDCKQDKRQQAEQEVKGCQRERDIRVIRWAAGVCGLDTDHPVRKLADRIENGEITALDWI